jgi:type I restriction enzyme S subunit
MIGELLIPIPPANDQRIIAAFLDQECAKIDLLISKQEKLVELLKEKRQAVIAHAVTKGLNPTVPMKPSGVEWLGDVPEHWKVVKSRRYFTQRKDRAMPGDRQMTASQKYGVIYQEDYMLMEGSKVMQVITGADILKHVEPNDFVISMRSFQGGIEWCGLKGSVSSAYVPLIPSDEIDTKFFSYLFKCKPYIQALQRTSNLVRDGQALRYDNFVQVDLPLMSLKEQAAIASFLGAETAKVDRLIAKAQQAISLQKEHRAALISAAVTGKIDVRESVSELQKAA